MSNSPARPRVAWPIKETHLTPAVLIGPEQRSPLIGRSFAGVTTLVSVVVSFCTITGIGFFGVFNVFPVDAGRAGRCGLRASLASSVKTPTSMTRQTTITGGILSLFNLGTPLGRDIRVLRPQRVRTPFQHAAPDVSKTFLFIRLCKFKYLLVKPIVSHSKSNKVRTLEDG